MSDAESKSWLRTAMEGHGGLRGANAAEIETFAEALLDREAAECAARIGLGKDEVRQRIQERMMFNLRAELLNMPKKGRLQEIRKRLQRIGNSSSGEVYASANQQQERAEHPGSDDPEILKAKKDAAEKARLEVQARSARKNLKGSIYS